jgi:hypothetical protein
MLLGFSSSVGQSPGDTQQVRVTSMHAMYYVLLTVETALGWNEMMLSDLTCWFRWLTAPRP